MAQIGDLEAQLMAVRNEVRDGWQELRGSISDIVSFMAGEEPKSEKEDEKK